MRVLTDLVLHGPRLTLRPWQSSDVDAVLDACADPTMHEFLLLPRPYTREDATRYVTEIGNAGRADGTGLGAAIVEQSSGAVVGSVDLRRAGNEDVGYWIAPAARGRGYAAEAVRVLCEWAFGNGVERVNLRCDVGNVASARTALSAGFGFEGISWRERLRHPETGASRVVDLARFARLAGDDGEPIAPHFPRLPPGELTDGTVALRSEQLDDLDGLLGTDDDLTLSWSFSGTPYPRERLRRACAQAGLDWLVGTAAPFSIVDVATGGYAGSMRLRQAGPPQIGGLGYVVHPAFRGRGYTTRALRLLVPWAFDVAGFARLELGAKVGNVASQRAALNAGFEPDGVRIGRMRNPDGSFGDEARFALLSPAIRRV